MNQIIKEKLKDAGGILLIIFGVIGLFLPILQGVLMILGGIAILKRKRKKEKD